VSTAFGGEREPLSPRLERAVTLLRESLRGGPMCASDVVQQARRVGLNRDDLKNAKRVLRVVALRDRDPQTGRTVRWRWSLPTHVPPAPAPRPRRLVPHRWGLYSYHTEGRYYYKQGEGETFKSLIARVALAPPLWVLLVTDAALMVPLRILADAVPALGGHWKRFDRLPRAKSHRGKP
jgi:hypothetical protein